MMKKLTLLICCSLGLVLTSRGQHLKLSQLINFQSAEISEINNALISDGWVLLGEDVHTTKVCGFRDVVWVFRPVADNRGNAFVRLSKKSNTCSNIILYQCPYKNTHLENRAALKELGMKLVKTGLLEIKGGYNTGVREIYQGAKLTAESVVASGKANSGKLVNFYFIKLYQTK